ncbi:MAG TPA: alkaline phosphatase family protein [Candidatus Binataceae bacterium]|nr:alkaline phosphatase family protein [Candidatus Binataceae bacterium]
MLHIVIMVKENHTLDNYFGTYPGADGVTVGNHRGKLLALEHLTKAIQDIPHSESSARYDYDNGLMDRFNHEGYGQYYQADITDYWNLATSYVLADEFFTSAMGPSFPNHLYATTATSFGAIDNPTQQGVWGCDSRAGTKVETLTGPVKPCFTGTSLLDELDAAHVSWAYYGPPKGQTAYQWVSLRTRSTWCGAGPTGRSTFVLGNNSPPTPPAAISRKYRG